jgi:phosphoglucosamine mutase
MNNQIKFGTDGIRGKVGTFPFVQNSIVEIGRAIALWAQKKYDKQYTKILIGGDTRESCEWIKETLAVGLSLHGARAVDALVLPTPAIYFLMKEFCEFDCGIVVSASHNPYSDNGIKIFDSKCCKLSLKDEAEIENVFFKGPMCETSELEIARFQPIETWPTAVDEYQRLICSIFHKNFLEEMVVVLDCANGATHKVAPAVFKAMGAIVHELSVSPDGKNINDDCGALFPGRLQNEVALVGASVGFAFDGDGDRVIAVNQFGQIKDGDDFLALLIGLPEYSNLDSIVGTVMTNLGFEFALNRIGKKLLRTSVGDKYVAERLENEGLTLGGETSGHIIMKDYLPSGDGIVTALKVLSAIKKSGNIEMKTFEKHPQVIINCAVKEKKDLSCASLSAIIDRHREKIGEGRILVRYSGTENVLRIMTEASERNKAEEVAGSLANELALILCG